jgi:hypothetical protein
MGRMLDALNRSEAKRVPPPVPLPQVPLPAVTEAIPIVDAVECQAELIADPVDESDAGGCVSFIEVGGARSAIDGSPDVLAAPVPRSVAVAPGKKPAVEEEISSAGMVSIWCSWTLRPGVKQS